MADLVWIDRLTVQHCRIIENAQLHLSPRLNLIMGDNGSGKSSVLEALYLLARGRSFRTHRIVELITHQQASIICSARLQQPTFKQTLDAPSQHNIIPTSTRPNTAATASTTLLGIEKSPQHTTLRLNQQTIKSQADLTRQLPITLIHPEVVSLIVGSPALRRAFIDWLAFYLHDDFYPQWQRYQRILKQRNACLRSPTYDNSLPYWSQELATLQASLHTFRLSALSALQKSLTHYQPILWADVALDLQLQTGFPADTDLHDQATLLTLYQQREAQDRKIGYTLYGVHRADLLIKINGILAAKSASRGQLKMLSLLLLLAQSHALSNTNKGRGIIAIDDLAAELDAQN
ncbi:MAG TPA: DNA replication and repair protein RecF, partial [Thiothrix sp.]|nr:DNA replication and repair protein RecF [Thiothrix sp.]